MKIYWKTLAAWAASVLPFVSCDSLAGILGGGVCEYGCPSTDYTLDLQVSGENGDPIGGIRVVVDESGFVGNTGADGKLVPEGSEVHNGTFLPNHIRFIDIDGEENGGSFETLQVPVDSLEVEQVEKGDGNWYRGRYEITGSVTMKLK